MRKIKSNECGGALLITLSLLLMLTLAAIMAVNTAQTDIELSFNQLQSDQAFYVAEAGLRRAFVQLNNDNDWNTGYANEAFEGGLYWVAVVDSFTNLNLVDTIVLKATSRKEDGFANLEAVVVPEYERPFQWAVYSESDISLGNNTCTDSWNSNEGDYDGTVDSLDGDIASNGTITLDQIADVGGDVSSSVDSGIFVGTNADVWGAISDDVPEFEIDPITEEEMEWAENVSIALTGMSGDYDYDVDEKTLTVAANETVTLTSGVYFFTDITLENNAILEIADSADVIIYMTGSLILNEASAVNPTQPPPSLLIYSTGGVYTQGQDTEISAAFYGPDAEIVLENSCDVYGSIVANTVEMDNVACVHYDKALMELKGDKTGEMLMVAWREF